MNLEKWMPVVGFEGTHEVSDHGRVRILSSGAIMRAFNDNQGYHNYNFKDADGNKTKRKEHRLVLEAFVGVVPGMFGLHRDDNPTNNHLTNLRWGTRLDNGADWIANGRRKVRDHNADKTHCPQGHAYSPENTYLHPSKRGNPTRDCRTCIALLRPARNLTRNLARRLAMKAA